MLFFETRVSFTGLYISSPQRLAAFRVPMDSLYSWMGFLVQGSSGKSAPNQVLIGPWSGARLGNLCLVPEHPDPGLGVRCWPATANSCGGSAHESGRQPDPSSDSFRQEPTRGCPNSGSHCLDLGQAFCAVSS